MSMRRRRCLSRTLATVLVAASCVPLGLAPAAALAAGSHQSSSTPTATAAASPTATAAASPTATAASSAATAAAPTVTTNPLSGGVSPLTPVPTTASTTPTVVTNATTAAPGSSSISSGSVIAIAVGAVIVLGGISFYIWRDARRRAPVAARTAGGGTAADGRGRPGTKPPSKPRKLSPAERRRRKRGRAR